MIQSLFDQFLRHGHYERGLSPRTLQSYADSFKLLQAFAGREPFLVVHLTTELCRNFLIHGREERGWSVRTFHIHHCNLKVFCQWLVLEGHLKVNPMLVIQKPKLKQVIKRPLRQEAVHKILYVALLKSAKLPFLRTRNHAMLMLALHTGLRMSEVLNLQIGDLNLEANALHVREGKGAKDRIVTMTTDLVSTMRAYLQDHERFYGMGSLVLFPSKSGRALTPREFRRLTDRVGCLAGVPFASHDLRRSYATGLSRNKVPPFIIQQQLGHSDIRVTMRYVSHDQAETAQAMKGVVLY